MRWETWLCPPITGAIFVAITVADCEHHRSTEHPLAVGAFGFLTACLVIIVCRIIAAADRGYGPGDHLP